MARRLSAIVFTDLTNYTPLSHSDERSALELIRELEKLVRRVAESHHGREVKSLGDGFLLEFPDALDAVEGGVDLQRRVAHRNAQRGTRPLEMRVGIHLGDVQRRGHDILGDAVNIASRIESLAEPGEICLSVQVYDQVRTKVPFRLESLGRRSLKGISEPLEVYRVGLSPVSSPSGPPAGSPPRLAVLPFVNISPDPGDEYFADGLTEELIGVLSQIGGLRVIARTSVTSYKRTTKPLVQIGSELGVSVLLEGSVRKAGDQLRIHVQLVDAGTQEPRWSHTYDRRLENIFAIQAEVAEETAAALKVELLSSEHEALQERPTENLAAYDAYLRGKEAAQQAEVTMAEEALGDAERYFEEAIRADPRFSAAYSALADHLVGIAGVIRRTKEIAPRARRLAAEALALDPNSSAARTVLGSLAYQVDRDWARAEREFQQAILVNRSNARARFEYAYLLYVLQRLPEAKKQCLAAIELDPGWALPRLQLAMQTALMGDAPGAIRLLEELIERFSDGPSPRIVLGVLHALSGRTEDAVRTVEPLAQSPWARSRAYRYGVLVIAGRRAEVEKDVRALLSDWERERGAGFFVMSTAAELYAVLGEKEKALALLERDEREGERPFWDFYQDPFLDPLRQEPRFIALLERSGLPTSITRPPELRVSLREAVVPSGTRVHRIRPRTE